MPSQRIESSLYTGDAAEYRAIQRNVSETEAANGVKKLFTTGGIVTYQGVIRDTLSGFTENDLPESISPEQRELFKQGGISRVSAFDFFTEDIGHSPKTRVLIPPDANVRLAKIYPRYGPGIPSIYLYRTTDKGLERQNVLHYDIGQLQQGLTAYVKSFFNPEDPQKNAKFPPRRIIRDALIEISRDEKTVIEELTRPAISILPVQDVPTPISHATRKPFTARLFHRNK